MTLLPPLLVLPNITPQIFTTMSVPTVVHHNKLSEIYDKAGAQVPRYEALLKKFEERYGSKRPDLLIRSPGRVNVIGEHIDYCFFSVLPMAVEADIIMAIHLTDEPVIEVANTNPDFPATKFDLPKDGSPVDIDASKSDWVNYFRCGLVVGQDYLKKNNYPCTKGIKVLIDGNVPTGSGLSSSAAFVVCSTLCTLLANGYTNVSKKLLTQLSTVCEQHVGVNSGGMDQSASIWGLKDHALFVSFLPDLNVVEFGFPETNPKLEFVIANSLVVSNKQETGPVNYNLRVVEVTLGALLMAKKLNLTIKPDGNLQAGTFRGVVDAYFANEKTPYGQDIQDSRQKLDKMIELVNELITQKDGYTTEQIASELDMSVDDLKAKFMTKYPVRYEVLKLYRRAYHVFTEAKRVLDFLSLLQSPPSDSQTLISELGNLMNQSQDSQRDYSNNSLPQLDEICTIARENGAAGARITGAGFGGSTVLLTPADKSQQVIDALRTNYYKKHYPKITDEQLADALLVSKPGSGTTIIDNLSLE